MREITFEWITGMVIEGLKARGCDVVDADEAESLSEWLEHHNAGVVLAELRELAEAIEDNVDWSDGRSGYGDNAGYAESAAILRRRVTEIEGEEVPF